MTEKLEKSRHDEVRDDIVVALKKTFPTKYELQTEKVVAKGLGRVDIAITFKKDGQCLSCEVFDTHPIELLSGPAKKITELVKRIEAKTDTERLTTIDKVKDAVLEIRESIIASVHTEAKLSEQERKNIANVSIAVGLLYGMDSWSDRMVVIAEGFIEYLFPKDFYQYTYHKRTFREQWIPWVCGDATDVDPSLIDGLAQLIEKTQKQIRKVEAHYTNLSASEQQTILDNALRILEPKSDVKPSKYVLVEKKPEK